MSVVPTNINYNYTILKQNLSTLKSTYSFLDISVAGKSVLGKNIYVVRLR